MGEHLATGGGINHEGTVDIEDFLPTDFVHLVIELLLVVGVEFGEGLEYGECRAAAVVGTVEQAHVAFELHSACPDGDILGTHLAQLLGEHFLEVDHGLGDHPKRLFLGAFYRHHLPVFLLYYHL